MEAFALNRPVISTCIAGIPELVEAGVSGWLIAAGDVDALANSMGEALETDPGRLAAMGEKGRQRTFERHRTDLEAANLKALFAAILARSGRVEPTG
jgi:glycosyltransferase involved in cell wall biosynthesis